MIRIYPLYPGDAIVDERFGRRGKLIHLVSDGVYMSYDIEKSTLPLMHFVPWSKVRRSMRPYSRTYSCKKGCLA